MFFKSTIERSSFSGLPKREDLQNILSKTKTLEWTFLEMRHQRAFYKKMYRKGYNKFFLLKPVLLKFSH